MFIYEEPQMKCLGVLTTESWNDGIDVFANEQSSKQLVFYSYSGWNFVIATVACGLHRARFAQAICSAHALNVLL